MRPLQADAILACLEQNGVRYVFLESLSWSSSSVRPPLVRRLLRERSMIRRNFGFIESESVSQSVPSTEKSAAIGLPLRVTTTGCRRTFRAYRCSASGALSNSRVFKLHQPSADAQLLPLFHAYGKDLHRRLRLHQDIVEDAELTNSKLLRIPANGFGRIGFLLRVSTLG